MFVANERMCPWACNYSVLMSLSLSGRMYLIIRAYVQTFASVRRCAFPSICVYLLSALRAWRGRAQRHRGSPCQILCLCVFPGGVTPLPRCTDQRADTCPNVVSPLLSPAAALLPLWINPLPLTLTVSLCLYIQLSSWLYQWGFWFHYCWGQSVLCRQGEWEKRPPHTLLYSQKKPDFCRA